MLLGASVAGAQPPLEVRRALARYEEPEAVLAAAARLEEADDDESRFLRVAVLADLHLLARLDGAPGLGGSVAEALGVEPGGAPEALDAALRSVGEGPFAGPVADARTALALLAGEAAPPGGRGARRDLAFLASTAEALRDGASPPVATPRGPAELPASARARLGALAEAARAASRLEALGERDPLVARLRARIARWRRRVLAARVPGALALPPGGAPIRVEAGEAPTALDAVVEIGPEDLRAGRVPGFAVDAEGEVGQAPAEGAELPALEPVEPASLAGARVGLRVAAGADGADLVGAVRALREAGARALFALGQGPTGPVALRLRPGGGADVGAEVEGRVLVRNGGVRFGSRRLPPGARAELRRVAAGAGLLELRTRRSVPAARVLEVAFAAAGERGEVVLR
ncbi:MAG: hypothetical protein CMN29_05430 [Sandaracinus sp.]|nr:hypothetical protein [Sandaracinus sp.]